MVKKMQKIKILSCNGWLNPEELINSSGADRETEVVTGIPAKSINLQLFATSHNLSDLSQSGAPLCPTAWRSAVFGMKNNYNWRSTRNQSSVFFNIQA